MGISPYYVSAETALKHLYEREMNRNVSGMYVPLQLVTAEGSRGRPHPSREVRRTALPWQGSVARRVLVCVEKIGSMITASGPG